MYQEAPTRLHSDATLQTENMIDLVEVGGGGGGSFRGVWTKVGVCISWFWFHTAQIPEDLRRPQVEAEKQRKKKSQVQETHSVCQCLTGHGAVGGRRAQIHPNQV